MVPVAFAALSAWQLEQPLALKTERPGAEGEDGVVEVDVEVVVDVVVVDVDVVGAGVAGFPCWRSQAASAAGFITIAWLRISEWPSPHSSVHSSGKVPTRSGVMCSCVTRPGTMSSFCEN